MEETGLTISKTFTFPRDRKFAEIYMRSMELYETLKQLLDMGTNFHRIPDSAFRSIAVTIIRDELALIGQKQDHHE